MASTADLHLLAHLQCLKSSTCGFSLNGNTLAALSSLNATKQIRLALVDLPSVVTRPLLAGLVSLRLLQTLFALRSTSVSVIEGLWMEKVQKE